MTDVNSQIAKSTDFAFGSKAEIVGSQKESSAIQRCAEPVQHLISWVISSEFGQERSFSKSLIVLGFGFERSIDIDSYI